MTIDPAADVVPVWTRDSRRIVFASNRDGTGAADLYWHRADGQGEAQRLTDSADRTQFPSSWHPTRNLLAFHDGTPPAQNQRVMLLEIAGDETSGWRPGTPIELIGGPYRNVMPMFSPDGRWIAYVSNKSGPFEMYVRPFPGPGEEVQISNGGANDPRWAPNRNELYYSTFGQGAGAQAQIIIPSRETAPMVAGAYNATAACRFRVVPRSTP